MAKLLKATPEYLAQVREEFEKMLALGKFPDGKVTFTKTIGAVDRKAKIYFTELAWLKMKTLIDKFDKEVGWHGVAKRGEDPEKDEYIISDILVYPQEVTGAAVNTDQVCYQTWLMEQENDVFNNLRMQGHSHVNMSTSPSSVDTTLYDGFLELLDDTMFYIFMIWNKRGEKTIKIYDMAKNIVFDTADCDIEVLGVDGWFEESKKLVTEKKAAVSTGYSSYVGAYSPYDDGLYESPYYKHWLGGTEKAKDETEKPDKTEKKSDKKTKRKDGVRMGRRVLSYSPYDDDADDSDDDEEGEE